MIMRTGEFTVSVISQRASFDLFKHFGFQTGREVNKFAEYTSCVRGKNGVYYITEGTNAYISVKVDKTEDGQTIWRCTICGYDYVGEELPEDFICPLCKHPVSDFEKVIKKMEDKTMANKYAGTKTEKK